MAVLEVGSGVDRELDEAAAARELEVADEQEVLVDRWSECGEEASEGGCESLGVRLKYSFWLAVASLLPMVVVVVGGKRFTPMSAICLRLRIELTSAGLILFMVSISSL